MEETISDLKESELNHIAMAEAFENLRGRLEQIGDEFVSTRTALQTRFEALQTREEEIGRREKLLEEKESGFRSKEAELEAIEEAITEKLLDFEEGKRHLKSLEIMIDEKEKECDLLRNRIEKGGRDLARVEEMEMKMRKAMEDWKCKVELKERELEERLLDKLMLKEKLLEPNVDELHGFANDVQECVDEVERREREVESKGREVELAEMRVNEGRNEVERKEREVEEKERRVEERRYNMDLKEKHLCAMEKLIEDNKKGLDLLMKAAEKREKELESLKKSVEDRERNLDVVSEELKRKERELQLQAEALELKRAQFGSQLTIQQMAFGPEANNATIPSPVNNISLFKVEEPESSLRKHAASFLSSNLQPIATNDEGYIPGFLNENSSGNSFVRNELATCLRLVPDPAKLVLNNMQKSLVQYLTKGKFEESIMLGNISILTELMSMSPDIGSQLKVDATYLALQWRKMIGNTENSMESLAFLLFLGTYGMSYMLNEDEIVKLLGLISQNKRTRELCQTPALAVWIADLIRNLIEKKRLPEAVKCICLFKLSDNLPLVPLLEEYVRDAMKCSEEICGLRITPDKKVQYLKNQMTDARALVQCLKDYNLGSKHPSNAIEIQIVQLETLVENWRLFLPFLCPSTVGQHDQRKRMMHNITSEPGSQSEQPTKRKFVIRGP